MTGVPAATEALRRGNPVVLTAVDGGIGGLVAGGASISTRTVAQLVRWGTGYLRVAILNATADRLDLPLLTSTARGGPAAHYTVSVDARDGVGTGISAADRARTIGLLADPDTTANALTRPGHVVPIRVHATASEPYDWPEATLDLPRLAGLPAAGVFCELVSARRPTAVADTAELTAFATAQGLVTVDLARLSALRVPTGDGVPSEQFDPEETARHGDPVSF